MTDPIDSKAGTPYRSNTYRGRGAALPLNGINRPLDNYAPVLALTLLTETTDSTPEILVGVRNPVANKTHQDVASVPTKRVPPVVANAWIEQLRRGEVAEAAARVDLRFEVVNIFSLKLGLADALELDAVRFKVTWLEATQGVSVIGEGQDGNLLTENLTMFNACVLLEKGRDHLPKATASYDPLVWGTVENFLGMTSTHDAGRLNAGLEGTFVCAYGLCLETSARMLNATGLARRTQG